MDTVDGWNDRIEEHDGPHPMCEAVADRRQDRSSTRVANDNKTRTARRAVDCGVHEVAPLRLVGTHHCGEVRTNDIGSTSTSDVVEWPPR